MKTISLIFLNFQLDFSITIIIIIIVVVENTRKLNTRTF
jgi:hypothetical protein